MAVAVALVLVACSTSTSSPGASTPSAASPGAPSPSEASSGAPASGGSFNVWTIQNDTIDPITQSAIDRFNAKSDVKAVLQPQPAGLIEQQLQITLGRPGGPDVFRSLGGQRIAGLVPSMIDLTPYIAKRPDWKKQFFSTIFDPMTFDGKIYGVPYNGIQPVVFFYNKDVFASNGVQPPKTWDDLLAAVKTFKAKGVTPISVGGAGTDNWTYLMWLEYLVDRVGGPSAVQAIISGQAGAWSSPDVIKANQLLVDLVKAGGFGDSYATVGYSNGQANALLYSGKAAMQLQGTWLRDDFLANYPEFLTKDKLGWFPFPAVTGGKGDPADVAGNLADYLSIATTTKYPDAAADFLLNYVMDSTSAADLIKAGNIPPIEGMRGQFANGTAAAFQSFLYDTAEKAPFYQLSWDWALPPAPATEMLVHLSNLFVLSETPEQFGQAMDQVH